MTNAATIQNGSRVRLRYSINLADGREIESSGDQGLELVMGAGEWIADLEERLIGMRPGERQTFIVSAAEEVFGAYDESNVQEIERGEFPADMELEADLVIGFSLPSGEEIPGVVRQVDENRVSVDFNHPLCEQDFSFDVEILEVDNSKVGTRD
jgi:FKBP-type peptidyl-prolyl cis-trans isomerase SlpA